MALLILVGNGFTCAVFLSTDQLRQNVMNIFLVSLAVSDISMAVLVPPFATFCGDCKYSASEHCWLFGGMRDTAFTWPTLNLLAITYDRYVAVLRPLQYSTKMTMRRVALLLLAVWSTPVVLALVRNSWQHTWTAQAILAANKAYNAFLVSSMVLLPLVVMLVVNLFIIRTIGRHRKRVQASVQASLTSSGAAPQPTNPGHSTSLYTSGEGNASTSSGQSRARGGARRLKGTLSCVSVVFIFILAWLPRVVYNFKRLTGESVSPVLTKTSLFLLLLQSSVNPFIYSFYRSDFRRASYALMRRAKLW